MKHYFVVNACMAMPNIVTNTELMYIVRDYCTEYTLTPNYASLIAIRNFKQVNSSLVVVVVVVGVVVVILFAKFFGPTMM